MAAESIAIKVCKFSGSRQPVSLQWLDFLQQREDHEQLFIVDIATQNAEALRATLENLDPNPLVWERCVDTDAVSGVFLYDDLLAVQLPITMDWEAAIHPKLTLLCQSNAFISLRAGIAATLPAPVVAQHMLSHANADVAALLLILLDSLVDHSSELTIRARSAIEQLESDILKDAGEDGVGDRILHFKRAVSHFEMALEAKHRTLISLLSLETDLIDLARIHEPLRDVASHIEHSLAYVERIDDRLSGLHQHFLLLLQGKTNRRLRMLTILSAIFMPLMLITGIYGMNFHDMPELGWRYAYPLVLMLMLVIALGLLWYFKFKGWFR